MIFFFRGGEMKMSSKKMIPSQRHLAVVEAVVLVAAVVVSVRVAGQAACNHIVS